MQQLHYQGNRHWSIHLSCDIETLFKCESRYVKNVMYANELHDEKSMRNFLGEISWKVIKHQRVAFPSSEYIRIRRKSIRTIISNIFGG